MDKSIKERAKAFADRHQEAELQLRGLGATYGYQRIYNAEIGAYERGATEQEPITRKATIADICEWLTTNADKYAVDEGWVNKYKMIEDLRKHFEADVAVRQVVSQDRLPLFVGKEGAKAKVPDVVVGDEFLK